MSISGRKDTDDTKKSSLQKIEGEKAPVGRPKKDATELFDKRIESGRMDEIVDLVFDGWERGLRSENDKLAADTAAKATKAFYNPDKKIIVEGPDHNEIHMNILLSQDNLSDKEKAALLMFNKILKQGAEDDENIVEGAIIEHEPGLE